jgi:hypothetical protein
LTDELERMRGDAGPVKMETEEIRQEVTVAYTHTHTHARTHSHTYARARARAHTGTCVCTFCGQRWSQGSH